MPHDWIGTGEGDLLCRWAVEGAALGNLLEIGSDVGAGSTPLLGAVARSAWRVLFCLDTFCDAPGFKSEEWRNARAARQLAAFAQNVAKAGLWDSIRLLRMTSDEAASWTNFQLGFVLIDGSHVAPCVDRDFAAWAGRVVPGGILAAHDIVQPDVAAAISDWLKREEAQWTALSHVRELQGWKKIR